MNEAALTLEGPVEPVEHVVERVGQPRELVVGTVEVDCGDGPAPASLTTPTAIETSALLARMVAAGCRAAVMEVSSHALAQRRVAAMRFAAGVFTNLTGDHLDYHGSMESYARAKSALFAALPPDGFAVACPGPGGSDVRAGPFPVEAVRAPAPARRPGESRPALPAARRRAGRRGRD